VRRAFVHDIVRYYGRHDIVRWMNLRSISRYRVLDMITSVQQSVNHCQLTCWQVVQESSGTHAGQLAQTVVFHTPEVRWYFEHQQRLSSSGRLSLITVNVLSPLQCFDSVWDCWLSDGKVIWPVNTRRNNLQRFSFGKFVYAVARLPYQLQSITAIGC